MTEIDVLAMKKARELQKKQNEDLVRQFSKKRLLENITKKFKTTMIGALSTFEREFGHLWGHGKDVENLTSEELKYREQWDIARTEILNRGNTQLRGALDEVSQHTVNKEKYRVDFIVRKDNQDG